MKIVFSNFKKNLAKIKCVFSAKNFVYDFFVDTVVGAAYDTETKANELQLLKMLLSLLF